MNKSLSLTVCLLGVAFFINICEAFPSSRQLLPAIPGYVPVYIRNGDTPLEDINLELAEAFHAIPAGRSAGRKDAIEAEPEQNDQPESLPEPLPESDNSNFSGKKEDADERNQQVSAPADTNEEELKAIKVATKPNQEVIDGINHIPNSVEQS